VTRRGGGACVLFCALRALRLLYCDVLQHSAPLRRAAWRNNGISHLMCRAFAAQTMMMMMIR